MSELDVRLHVGQGTHRGPLTVFPVWTDAPSPMRDYVTGEQASVDVEERAGSPAVDQLVITNRSDRPALLLTGELLEGGWQHRALVATTLLAPNRPTVLPVRCVEQGRWGGETGHRRQFRRVPSAVLARIEGQHAVWEQVRRYEAVGGPSATESLTEQLDRSGHRTHELITGLRPLAGQRGVLLGIAGRPAWLELFDSSRTLRTHWSGLMQAACLDAAGQAALRTPAALARAFTERVEKARLSPAGAAGLGRRFCSRANLAADAVRWNDRLVHLTALDLTHPLQEA
jgi:hypothetical protein